MSEWITQVKIVGRTAKKKKNRTNESFQSRSCLEKLLKWERRKMFVWAVVTHRRNEFFFIMLISNLPSVRVRSSWYKGKRGQYAKTKERKSESRKFFFSFSRHTVSFFCQMQSSSSSSSSSSLSSTMDGYVQPPRQRCRRRPPTHQQLFSLSFSLSFFFRVLSLSPSIRFLFAFTPPHRWMRVAPLQRHRLFFLRFNNFLSMFHRSINEEEEENESLRPKKERNALIENETQTKIRYLPILEFHRTLRKEEKKKNRHFSRIM